MPPLPPPLRCGLSGFGSVYYDANPYQSLGVGFCDSRNNGISHELTDHMWYVCLMHTAHINLCTTAGLWLFSVKQHSDNFAKV